MSVFDMNRNQNMQYSNTGNQYPWQQNRYQTSNVVYVTGPEEALLRTTGYNIEMVYFHQDQPIFYRVKTDMEGRKTWQHFQYSMPNPDLTTPATRADLAELANRIKALEESNKSSTEVNNNDESNG